MTIKHKGFVIKKSLIYICTNVVVRQSSFNTYSTTDTQLLTHLYICVASSWNKRLTSSWNKRPII